jgi:hypothetical protein
VTAKPPTGLEPGSPFGHSIAAMVVYHIQIEHVDFGDGARRDPDQWQGPAAP